MSRRSSSIVLDPEREALPVRQGNTGKRDSRMPTSSAAV
jgi:hypothetical protein